VKTAWTIACTPTRTSINTTRSNIKHAALATGLNTTFSTSDITVYPNPATDLLTITLPIQITSGVLKLYNDTGELIVTEVILSNQKKIDLSGLSDGIYLLSVESSEIRRMKKIIIEH
jgi:hypothetical protein